MGAPTSSKPRRGGGGPPSRAGSQARRCTSPSSCSASRLAPPSRRSLWPPASRSSSRRSTRALRGRQRPRREETPEARNRPTCTEVLFGQRIGEGRWDRFVAHPFQERIAAKELVIAFEHGHNVPLFVRGLDLRFGRIDRRRGEPSPKDQRLPRRDPPFRIEGARAHRNPHATPKPVHGPIGGLQHRQVEDAGVKALRPALKASRCDEGGRDDISLALQFLRCKRLPPAHTKLPLCWAELRRRKSPRILRWLSRLRHEEPPDEGPVLHDPPADDTAKLERDCPSCWNEVERRAKMRPG